MPAPVCYESVADGYDDQLPLTDSFRRFHRFVGLDKPSGGAKRTPKPNHCRCQRRLSEPSGKRCEDALITGDSFDAGHFRGRLSG